MKNLMGFRSSRDRARIRGLSVGERTGESLRYQQEIFQPIFP